MTYGAWHKKLVADTEWMDEAACADQSPDLSKPGPKPRPAIDRFMTKVMPHPCGCVVWAATRNNKGYGWFYSNTAGRQVLAHRWSYEYFVGPIPDGLDLDHLCSTPYCVNPDHLEPVTHAENQRRMGARRGGRYVTHCRHGHEYTPENSYVDPRGKRLCRTCQRLRDRNRRSAQ